MLDGAAHPEQLIARAVELKMPALALTDHEDLGGAVRFSEAAESAGLNGIIGTELTLEIHAPAAPCTSPCLTQLISFSWPKTAKATATSAR